VTLSPSAALAYPACGKPENTPWRLAVDFGLNEEQEMMQTLAKDFLAAEYPDKVLKAMAKDDKGYTPELWKKMQEMNLMGLSLPEQYGGVGDFLDLTVVLEEMGRVCFISPYFATVVLGAGILMIAGSAEQKQQYLTPFAEGKKIATVAIVEKSIRYSPEAILTTAKAQGGDYVINGAKLFVPDAQNADYIICAARTSESQNGITLFIIPADASGLTITPLGTFGGDKQAEVTFNNVKVPVADILGEIDKGWSYLEKLLERANIASCAVMVGLAEQALKLTLDYVKERNAYGHPIGAFQSIQHRAADMLMDVESSRYITYQAAWKVNAGIPAARDAAAAKTWVSQAGKRVLTSAHQLHGAIGMTEDHVLHYYTKRLRSCEFSFGGTDDQLEKLAEL
jgi:alkylation response protein AidB-like acyl-CoA dehydrogenase